MINHYSLKPLIVASVFIVSLLTAGSPVPASADPQSTIKDLDQAYVQIAEKVSPTVVRVSSTKTAPASTSEGWSLFLSNFPFSLR